MAEHGDEGAFVPTESVEEFVRRAGAPAPDHHHGQGRRRHRRGDRRAHPAAGARRHRGRRRQRPLRRHPAARGRAARPRACTSSAPASPAARRARSTGRASCPADRPSRTRRWARCSSRSPRRSTARPAARTSGRTAPGTSSRWCTTASSTPTCSSSPRRTTCCATARACTPAQIAEIFPQWNEGDLESFLIEITAEVLGHVDAATGKPFVDVVADRAGQKGTGGWTVQIALDLGIPVSGIAASVFARSLSGQIEQRAAMQYRAGVADREHHAAGARGASSTTSAARCTPPRWSRTRRAST